MHSDDYPKAAGTPAVVAQRASPLARYVIVAGVALLAGVASLVGLAMYLGFPEGDLTRTGWFSEHDFGWTAPQRAMRESMSAFKEAGRNYDVVVIGDSFSVRNDTQVDAQMPYWHQLLAARTGWSIFAVHVWAVDVNKLTEQPWFARSPPKLVIYQVVERNLQEYPYAVVCDPQAEARAAAGAVHRRIDHEQREIEAATQERLPNVDHIDLAYVRSYLWKNTLRAVFGDNVTPVRVVDLREPVPFSSRVTDRMLVYEDDLRKAKWPAGTVAAFRCRLNTLAETVERNGTTRFIVLVVPDKLSAYAPFLRDPALVALPKMEEIHAQAGHRFVDVFHALRAAVDRREGDVYLPNDTHWGYTGHRIVADSVLEFVDGSGVK